MTVLAGPGDAGPQEGLVTDASIPAIRPGSGVGRVRHAHTRSAGAGARASGRWLELVDIVVVLLATVWISTVLGLSFWSVAPKALGWTPQLVLTGSMRPAIDPGDVVLVLPVTEPVIPGHIALVSDPSRAIGTYLHRVVRYDDAGLAVTKGDANQTEDVQHVPPSRIKGEARVMVPHIGLPVVWMHEGRYAPVVAVVLMTWLAAVVSVSRDTPTAMVRRLLGRS